MTDRTTVNISSQAVKAGTTLEEEIKRYLHDTTRFLVLDEMQIQCVDWRCPYCGSMNHPAKRFCTQCGGSV